MKNPPFSAALAKAGVLEANVLKQPLFRGSLKIWAFLVAAVPAIAHLPRKHLILFR